MYFGIITYPVYNSCLAILSHSHNPINKNRQKAPAFLRILRCLINKKTVTDQLENVQQTKVSESCHLEAMIILSSLGHCLHVLNMFPMLFKRIFVQGGFISCFVFNFPEIIARQFFKSSCPCYGILSFY